MASNIILKQVRQHNLNISNLSLPMHQVVGVTGPSGSGKSSLVVHTLFAESQRKYLSSLSTYQRQFFERWARPKVEEIHNLGASLYVGPKNNIKNARASVGTTSGLYPLFANLFAYYGKRVCPKCESDVYVHTSESFFEALKKDKPQSPVWVGFPLHFVKDPKIFKEEVSLFLKQGMDRLCLQSSLRKGDYKIENLMDPGLLQNLPGAEVVFLIQLDRPEGLESCEELFRLVMAFSPRIALLYPEQKKISYVAIQEVCAQCEEPYGTLLPEHFSFYSSLGACPGCQGFGAKRIIDVKKLSAEQDSNLSIEDGFFSFFESPRLKRFKQRLLNFCEKHHIPKHAPWFGLSESQQDSVLYGEGRFGGLKGFFKRLEENKYKMWVRIFLNQHYSEVTCDRCDGSRLIRKSGLATLNGLTIQELMGCSIEKVQDWLHTLLKSRSFITEAADPLIARLSLLMKMGVGYLPLNRASKTLSGGEVQRLSLIHHIGTQLSDTLYVLDEPSVGLHPKDCEHVVSACQALVKQGNHVLMVEHDESILSSLDHVVELGPGSGKQGGKVVWQGKSSDWKERRFKGREKILVAHTRKKNVMAIECATGHNLQNVSCELPLQSLVGVCGVSGSGKTSLIIETLVPYLEQSFGQTPSVVPLPVSDVNFSVEAISDVQYISQSLPIRSSRANLLTFSGAMNVIRQVYAATPESQKKKFKVGHFSFNSVLGQCPTCQGAGEVVFEMVFMEDLRVPCEQCRGSRYKDEVLKIQYQGHTISDILKLTVDEAAEFFEHDARLTQIFSILQKVGLGYLAAGQGIHTYSGGELQRLKISRIFMSPTRRPVLYVLDEPTTGLHRGEVAQLLRLFRELIELGHSVIVIEHHAEVLAHCDHLIELGPVGGDEGGKLIFQGPVSRFVKSKKSPTAPFVSPLTQ